MSEQSTVHQGNKRKEPPSVSVKEACNGWLDWRMDPAESYSDWKIEISVDGKIQGIYHVHRGILSVGSTYFARMFANTALKEHETHTSCIETEELAANVFPLMLDYLYHLWDNDNKPVMAENAVTLHHLGRYFEISGLRKEARTFWEERSMTIDQAVTYLEHANVFHDDQARDAVVQQCVTLIGSITVDSRLMEVSDAEFWLAVLNKDDSEPNPELSTLASSFCSKNKGALDTETFLKLTDKSVMPQLSVGAAMELLQLEKSFGLTSDSATELSCLQERCIEALISCDDTIDQPYFMEVQRQVQGLPHLVMSQILQRAMGKVWECNKELKAARNCVPKEIVASGAMAGVDGTYSRASDFDGRAPHFVKNGMWDAEPVTFVLNLKAGEGPGGSIKYEWCISVLKGTRPSNEDEDIYYAPCEVNACLPPQEGWRFRRIDLTFSGMRLAFHF